MQYPKLYAMNDTLLQNEPPVREKERGRNNLFPVFLKLEQLRLLLVGGGTVGLEKLRAVLNNAPHTNITLVAAQIAPAIKTIAEKYANIKLIERPYTVNDLINKDLVIAAVNDPITSDLIYNDAKAAGLLVNVADKPQRCDFYLGSIVQKGDLKIAISTNGKSPTVAKRLRAVLEESIPDQVDELLQNMQRLRSQMKGDFSTKVIKLNQLTRTLALHPEKDNRYGERKWRKVAYWCFFAFFFMFSGNLIAAYITIPDIGRGLTYLSGQISRDFYLMIVAGFLAQLVDGALGMGYGVTCASVMLSVGIPLPAISSSIHTAEVFSSGVSGFSHYKFGNVNKKLFRIILLPGIAGAAFGAFLLSKFGEDYAVYFKPLLAGYTLFLGIRIFLNAFKKNRKKEKLKNVGWLAGAGGFLDSFGGGGWGPLVTSTLISKGKNPRYVIGTISLTEFFVTIVSAITFFSFIGINHWQVIAGLIIGGVAGAPLAARLAGRLPIKAMFMAIGAMIVLWSLHILVRALV